MRVIAPAARDQNRYLMVNGGKFATLVFGKNRMEPKDVSVKYNYKVSNLTVTDVNLMLKLLVIVE